MLSLLNDRSLTRGQCFGRVTVLEWFGVGEILSECEALLQ